MSIRVVFLLIGLVSLTCCDKDSGKLGNLKGDANSLKYANRLIEKLGGVEKWRNFEAIAITNQLSEGQKEYTSLEVYNVNNSSMILEYNLPDGKLTRQLVGDTAWVIRSGDKEVLNKINSDFLKYWRDLNYYNVIHDIVSDTLFVRYTDQNHLMFLSPDRKTYKFGFALNEDYKPKIFYRPKFNEQDISLELNNWREIQGVLIPTSGSSLEEGYKFNSSDIVIEYE